MKNKVLILGLLLAISWPVGSSAAWSDDPAENTQLTDAGGAQHSPVMVSDGNDGAYIAWVDDASGNSDIYVQHVDANGDVQWASDGVEVIATADNETDPQLVANADGGVYVVWEVDTQNGDIWGQRLSAEGAKLWGFYGTGLAVGVRTQNTPRVTTPPLYPDGTRGIVVAYNRQRPSSARSDVYAAQYSNGGVLRSRDAMPTGTTALTVPIMFGSTYLLYRMNGSEVGIGRFWRSGSIAYSSSFRTFAPGSTLEDPFLLEDGVLTGLWERVSAGVSIVRLRRITEASAWPEAGYRIASTGNTQTHPRAVRWDGSTKSEIITWIDGSANRQNIRAQRMFRKVRMWTDAGVVVTNAAGNQRSQEMIQADDGGAIVAWIDERSSPNGDIYSQRIGLDGTMSWQANGVPVSTRGGVQTALKIIPSGSGFIAVWTDGTGDNRDIYVQLVNGDGTL